MIKYLSEPEAEKFRDHECVAMPFCKVIAGVSRQRSAANN